MYQPSSLGTQSVFEVLRDEIPLERLLTLESSPNGVRKVSCIAPHHEDREPSMHVYENHVHCFGCGFHGDGVDVWRATRGIERPIEAAFDLAREFNVQLPEMSEEGRKKAEEARLIEGAARESARGFHELLEKQPGVREWWERRGFGPDLQEKFLLGASKDGTQAILPFWHRGRIKGMIRRKLEGEPKYILPSTEELPDGHKPLFIPDPIRGDEIFLVEGFVDALAAGVAGKSVAAIGGTNISDTQQEELRRLLPEDAHLYILTDADESGVAAALSLSRLFFPKAKVCPAHYGEGNKDIADLFAAAGPDETADQLGRLVLASRDALDVELEKIAEIEGGPREKLTYARENIIPLLARIGDESLRDALADMVVDAGKGLKKNWLTKSIKAHLERLQSEWMETVLKMTQEEAEREQAEYLASVGEAQEDIDALVAAPGVLERLRDTAAKIHNVYADEEPLELALLVALGAQLEPLPNGRPLGASILLTAGASRGKNHIIDAAVKPLPEEFYFAFEIASGQSLYYKADEDPDFLKHTFAYPNEIEGAEQLWEFLRPMLSKGRATKIVTAKDADGNLISRTIIVEGPVTVAIPTIRNKTDEQLQTRLLVAELPDYPGRVKHHSLAVSEQLLPDAAAADYSREKWLWQEGLRQLTAQRRVVFPLKHPDFAFDDDSVSHGARLWANLLSLMATNAWLEQRNRRLIEVANSRIAIEATPEDYAVAYRIFTMVAKRSMVNLSDAHRKILGSIYDLHQEFVGREGFSQREIAKGAQVSQSVVSDNKTFLVMSAKLIKETDHGLALVEGAEPSWWAEGDMMAGLPTPAKVAHWWEKREDADRDRRVIGEVPISENGIGKPNTGDREEVIGVIGVIGGFRGVEEVICEENDPGVEI